MSNTLTPQRVKEVREVLSDLEAASLTAWEEGFIANVIEQLDDDRGPWMTEWQTEVLNKLRDQKT
jgi:hypothetical protein